jgi:catechol 2,3-dioxygenase-like lactoylglutathione lyase family enzyme
MMTGIQHVQISVEPDQLEATRHFYVDILGATPMRDWFPQSGGFWLRAGTSEIHVRKEQGIDRLKTRAHVAYIVSSLAEVRKKLEAEQFPIHEQPKITGFNRIHTTDPAGNRVEIIEHEKDS